jgi:hypothetical protein
MIAVLSPSQDTQISFRFFILEVALFCLPLAVYLLRANSPTSALAQAFGFGNPLFYCMTFFEHFLPVIVFYLAVCMDLNESTWSKTLGFVTGYITCLMCLTFFSATFPSAADTSLRDRFTSKRWKDSLVYGSREELRLYMVSDLLDRYKLEGKSRKEIEDLLGVPPPDSMVSTNDYVYYLGNFSGCPTPDLQHLILIFRDGVVSKVMWAHHL